MHVCLFYHPKCQETISGFDVDEETEPLHGPNYLKIRAKSLPSRVIDVTYALPHTNNAEQALSRCWGKCPLTTTTGSLADRLNGIPFQDLSQTFRDAVTTT
jgi:hypothetical protein